MKSKERERKEFDQKLYRKLANLDSSITAVANYLVKEEITDYNVPKIIQLRCDFNQIFKDILENSESFKNRQGDN